MFLSHPAKVSKLFLVLSPTPITHREPTALAFMPSTVQQICYIGFSIAWATGPRFPNIVPSTQCVGGVIRSMYRLLSRDSPLANLCVNLFYLFIHLFIQKTFIQLLLWESPILTLGVQR